MRVFVNGEPVDLLPGMRVRHALIQMGLLEHGEVSPAQVWDQWGNNLGLDGALQEGDRIFLSGEGRDQPPKTS